MAKAKVRKKIPVSERALLARVNRKLAHDYKTLRKWRSAGNSGPWHWETGDYYLLDQGNNLLREFQVDLESFASELGVLADYEEITS
jgi:hypothetical protein